MNKFKTLYIALGFAFALLVGTVVAYVPSMQDFDSTYFSTNSFVVSVKGNTTNWFKLSTNTISVSVQNVVSALNTMASLTNTAGTVTVNFATNGMYAVVADTPLTFAGTGLTAGSSVTLEIVADGSNRALAWDSNWVWMGAPVPTTTSANKIIWVTLYAKTNTAASVRAFYAAQVP